MSVPNTFAGRTGTIALSTLDENFTALDNNITSAQSSISAVENTIANSRYFAPRVVVLTSGSSWTVPAGVSAMKVTVVGAGGGSSGAYWCIPTCGGGAGGTAVKYFNNVVAGTVCSYSIGSGGSAGQFDANFSNGGNGGNTTFTYSGTTLTANGGTGSKDTSNATAILSNGIGGSATGGDINIKGQNGQYPNTSNSSNYFPSGDGGSVAFGIGIGGRGGAYNQSSVSEQAGTGFGSGAGGGGGSIRTGYTGQAGVIIIEY
jgi:hypothetical protein